MDQLVKLPNHVPERQRFYQASHKPLYVRSPRGNLYYRTWLTGLSVGLVGITYGVVQMISGKPAA